MIGYHEFINDKLQQGCGNGFEPNFLPGCLFDFQKHLVIWAIKTGRSALFEDCGLGKTIQELVWSKNVANHTRKPVLNIAPLAVAQQTVGEGNKFGIDVERSRDGVYKCDIVVTNYQKLHLFKPDEFSGVVCDESSILKNDNGKFKQLFVEFARKIPYRLLGTATAAPNDFIELGTSSESLGYLGYVDMLTRFFKNDQSNVASKRMYGEAPKWRFKKHSETPFWRWVTSWARAIRKPSDIGFCDDGYKLPNLIENIHTVDTQTLPDGYFLPVHAKDLQEQREEKRRTIPERCEYVRMCVEKRTDQSTIWCQLDDEGDLLEKIIPNSVQVHGRMTDDLKEELFLKFSSGQIQRLITKPKIGAFGMNWQNCCHLTHFPEHSFERKYQLTRRHYRYGQKNDVVIDTIMTEGERKILNNVKRKEEQAVKMFDNLVREMNNSLHINRTVKHSNNVELPSWL